jgi:hypothetical protein
MRLIDADALIDFIDCGHLRNPLESCFSERDVVDMLESRPTIDAVPVVRCSECINHGTLTNGNLFCGKRLTGVYGVYHVVKPDDYCSYGKR